jgi:DNA-binding transcriptional LysR family regulator
METRRIKFFIAIYESRSISKAALECGIAQPAMSQQLAVLEAELKTRLFERSSQGVVATSAGDLLYRRAKGLLWQIDELAVDLRLESPHWTERVSIGLPATLAASVGLPLIEAVREKDHRILLQLVEGRGGDLREMVESSRLSAAIVLTQGPQAALAFEVIASERLYCISPASWKLPENLSTTSLADIPLILTSHPHTIRVQVEAIFSRLGLSPKLVAEADSVSLIWQAILRGVCASILPMGIVDLSNRESVSISPVDDNLQRPLVLCTREGRPKTSAERLVIDCLRNLVSTQNSGQ